MGKGAGDLKVIEQPVLVVTFEVRKRNAGAGVTKDKGPGEWVVTSLCEALGPGAPLPELLELVAESADGLWLTSAVGGWWYGDWREEVGGATAKG